MKIILRRVQTGYHDPHRGWSKGFIQADVDGYGVAYRESHGWDCRCPDEDCPHIGAVADLIADDVLERIEAGRT